MSTTNQTKRRFPLESSKGNKRNREKVEAEVEDEAFNTEESPTTPFVFRCGERLHVMTETLHCACIRKCVACAHKICAEEPLYPHSKPNVRPETCPRASSTKLSHGRSSRAMGLYPAGQSVLTVGDGDLSFSLALANFLFAINVVATTFESRESIVSSYRDTGRNNIRQLQELQVELHHGVDASDLESTLHLNEDRKFDFIVFNFPCIATEVAGDDGQSEEMATNQLLLQRFGSGAQRRLKPGGFVHISHKTKAAFKNWRVAEFVSRESELECVGAVVFDRCVYPGYINRKARDRKSFPATDAVTYVFTSREHPGILYAEGSDESGKSPVFSKCKETVKQYISRMQDSGLTILPVTLDLLDSVKRSLVVARSDE